MTKEQFIFMTETRKPLEFKYNNKIYSLNYDKNDKGELIFTFGRLYEGEKYDSIGELLNKAKIENHFFKDILDIL